MSVFGNLFGASVTAQERCGPCVEVIESGGMSVTGTLNSERLDDQSGDPMI